MKTKIELGKSVWRLVDDSLFTSVYSEFYSPVNKSVWESVSCPANWSVYWPVFVSINNRL